MYLLLGEQDRSLEAFEAARVPMEDENREEPDNQWLRASLGLVYAGLGRKSEAITEGKRATRLCPVTEDPMDAGAFIKNLALIYTMVGDHDAAVVQIEFLISDSGGGVEYLPLFPSQFSLPMLQLDPRWSRLWDHPRFRARVEKTRK